MTPPTKGRVLMITLVHRLGWIKEEGEGRSLRLRAV